MDKQQVVLGFTPVTQPDETRAHELLNILSNTGRGELEFMNLADLTHCSKLFSIGTRESCSHQKPVVS